MKSVLITGACGLIGSATVKKFLDEGWYVYGVDNNMRKQIFGNEADTQGNLNDIDTNDRLEFIESDIRDNEKIKPIIQKIDAIVHLAAQPSHPKSLEIPMEDFQINAFGTLNLLELTRMYNKGAPFAYMSSNKVYGDAPNFYNYAIIDDGVYKRYENTAMDSFDETLTIDGCGHTPFGVSNLPLTFIARSMLLISA